MAAARLLHPLVQLTALTALLGVGAPALAQPTGAGPWLVAPAPAAYRANVAAPPRVSYAHPGLAPLVEDVARRSPFLRRQLERLMGDERVLLSLTIVNRRTLTGMRAVTHIERIDSGRLRADIAIGLDIDVAELLGHELEHVIERLDGVDVSRALDRGDAAVHHSAAHAFETKRAQLAGRIVSAERAGRRLEVQP